MSGDKAWLVVSVLLHLKGPGLPRLLLQTLNTVSLCLWFGKAHDLCQTADTNLGIILNVICGVTAEFPVHIAMLVTSHGWHYSACGVTSSFLIHKGQLEMGHKDFLTGQDTAVWWSILRSVVSITCRSRPTSTSTLTVKTETIQTRRLIVYSVVILLHEYESVKIGFHALAHFYFHIMILSWCVVISWDTCILNFSSTSW